MRRVLYSLVAVGLFGMLAGCCHTHGVCDCDYDDHCYTRQPWIGHSGATAAAISHAMPIPVRTGDPAPLPLEKGKTRETPKELPPVRDDG
jgi:hypothetical protein